jgi:hypothetical protein
MPVTTTIFITCVVVAFTILAAAIAYAQHVTVTAPGLTQK